MSNSKVLLSISLFFFFISFASSSSFNATSKCPLQQTLDLLLFKQNLSSINHFDKFCHDWLGSDYHPLMMNWKRDIDCCKWDGITCNHFTGDVIGIDLSCGMLRGTIHPNSTLFHLPHLQTLNLAYNDFTASQFPHESPRFSNSLTHLNISECWFTGEISKEFLHLSKLVSLDLSWNFDLHMQPYVLENMLQNSTHLREVVMNDVDIGWVLPRFFNISSSLKSLDLSSTGLKGKLPHNIFSLPYLERLDLPNNDYLTGRLPKVNTSNNIPLRMLDLSHTNLLGEIPDSIGHLKSLSYLDLSDCGLVGSLPKSLHSLTHLTTLLLQSNMLNGTFPSLLFTLPFIENILLGGNMFSGGLSLELFNCPSLKQLSLSGNKFDGRINQGSTPTSFMKHVNLTRLDLSMNNFIGVWDFDTLLSSLPNLQYLDLSYSGLFVVSDNSFSYVNPDFMHLGLASCKLNLFPESLRAMKNIRSLDLSNNNIHGRIPDWVQEIGGDELIFLDLSNNFVTGLPKFQWDGLDALYLHSNQIDGLFPSSICNMRKLHNLDISNNSFSGLIPQCLGNTSSFLNYLNVGSNKLHGPFPSSICNLSQLTLLDMSNNSFYGVIPQCWGNITFDLKVVDLGNNRFHGSIPDVFKECGHLEGFILNGNKLQGEVPSSLSKCQSLMVLDLGNNQLNGLFPHWVGNLPALQVFVLKSNKLHGTIEAPSTITSAFPSLRILDISHNGFVGFLPQKYLQNFNAMKNVVKNSTKPDYIFMDGTYYSVTTAVKGLELEFLQISVDYVIVDLSNNKFEGEIPDVIGCLTSLIVLDLSNNNLIGQIPYILGNLLAIESLDLSRNKLTGEIPRSLAGLNFLEFLNISENHLMGRIPSGTQFGTFETSFGGNPELCGFPLTKTCEDRHETQFEDDGYRDEESGFTWRVVMMGYGCGTLSGLVIGYVMLSTRRPKWFNAIVDVGEHMIQTRGNKTSVYIGK